MLGIVDPHQNNNTRLVQLITKVLHFGTVTRNDMTLLPFDKYILRTLEWGSTKCVKLTTYVADKEKQIATP